MKSENLQPNLLIATILVAVGCFALPSWAIPPSSDTVIRDLKEIQKHHFARIKEINDRLQKVVEETHQVQITQDNRARIKSQLELSEKEMGALRKDRKEFLLRQNFVDRLTFQVDNYYRGGDLKEFIIQSVRKMAHQEARDLTGSSEMLKFLNYLSVAASNLPERGESVIAFVEGYMNFSSIMTPIRPDQYVSLRDYTNGSENQTANAVSQDSVGEIVEGQIDAINAQKAEHNETVVFELRQPLLKGVYREVINEEPKTETASPSTSPSTSLQRPDTPISTLKETKTK